ncbi:hypothetical protein FNO01nite_29330 [Flavobacterium noncentrifugens]|nr:T9SS type A sorting domain-containing protein [Flavobacterium noncentrifugens]GEP52261.1 hypothetical protein FNO01nite_29330 [Flavobacterium noncentrifugens]
MKKTILLLLLLFGFVFSSSGQASLCEDAVPVSLPYSTTDDTANYGNEYHGTPGDFSSCGTPNTFLNGNDVVYAYTADFDGAIHLDLSTESSFVGLFVYGSCSDIGQNCLAAAVMEDINSAGYLSIEAFPVTTGQTYYFVISSWPAPQTVAYHLNIAANTCTNATATYTVHSDCGLADQFLVAVAVVDLGSATSLTITNSVDTNSQSIAAPGIVTFGPYANGTPVSFTIANDQDANCFITSAPQNQTICAPANNFCSDAVDLALETSPLNGTTIGATNQNNTSCATNRAAGDVYYSMLVPNTYTLTIGMTATDYDAMATLFFGSCDNQIELTCFDDESTVYNYVNNTGTDQTFYWVQDGFNGNSGNFTLAWNLSSCVTPDAIYTVVPDCANGEQFLVTADVFSLGSAASVTVTDDQESTPQNLTATGQVQFGPYPNNTLVTFTVTNDDETSCFLVGQPVTQEVCPPTCTNAAVNFNPFFNCPNTNGYYVNAEVTDLGTATSIALSDDQGSASQSITATGTYQFGPYADYTPVLFTVSDEGDGDCVMTYNIQSFSNCPSANDDCAAAITLIPGNDMDAGSLLTTNHGASPSPELPRPTCAYAFFGNFGKDVWYTVAVPASGNLTIGTGPANAETLNLSDTALQLYSGDCAALTPIECSGSGSDNMNTFASVTLTGRTPGEILYIRAYGTWGTQGAFVISAYDASLASTDFDYAGLVSYPNPVKDILNLSYFKTITTVRVFNLLGQEVMAKAVNEKQSGIDMSTLPEGTYLVKIFAGSQTKTIKVIKA